MLMDINLKVCDGQFYVPTISIFLMWELGGITIVVMNQETTIVYDPKLTRAA